MNDDKVYAVSAAPISNILNDGYATIANTHKPLGTIQGQMISYNMQVEAVTLEDLIITPEALKKKLVEGLLEEAMKTKHIEFTKVQDNLTGNWLLHARMFVVPDTQVRILRTNGY